MTNTELQTVVDSLNTLTGNAYHLDFHPHGGVALHETRAHGIHDPLSRGHMKTDELYELLNAFIRGFNLAKTGV
jgi:hypothetical protein